MFKRFQLRVYRNDGSSERLFFGAVDAAILYTNNLWQEAAVTMVESYQRESFGWKLVTRVQRADIDRATQVKPEPPVGREARRILDITNAIVQEKIDLYNRTCDRLQSIAEANGITEPVFKEMIEAIHEEFRR